MIQTARCMIMPARRPKLIDPFVLRVRENVMKLCAATIAILSFGLVAGCSRKPASTDGGKDSPAQPTFTTVKPERKTLERTIEQPASVTAYEETPIEIGRAHV